MKYSLPPPYDKNLEVGCNFLHQSKNENLTNCHYEEQQHFVRRSNPGEREIQKEGSGLPREQKMSLFARNDTAFTLAEVLITLVIIGVIVAITVPTLIAKYQKEQTVTRLKKAYSALAQTTNRAITDYGPVSTWVLGEFLSGEDAKTFLDKYITPYMSVMSKTTVGNNSNWSANYKLRYLNSNTQHSFSSNAARFYLNDGTSITAL